MINNVTLRDVTESDLPTFFEQQLDPEATAMAAFPSRDRETFMIHWAQVMADDSTITRTILFDSKVAGNIISWEQSGEREIGYWLGKEYWSKGIATKALEEFLGVVKTRPLQARVAKHNLASRRVLEKCGFTIMGENTFMDKSGKEIEELILKLA